MKKLKRIGATLVLIFGLSLVSTPLPAECLTNVGESYWSMEGMQPALCHETITVCDAPGGGYDVEIQVSCMSFFSDWLFYYL